MKVNDNNNQQDIDQIRYLIIKFKIEGTLRFLSHSQTLSLFQRAVIRAGINAHYSQGFNPRAKISLPLPRPLGIESDDEVLVMPISIDSESVYNCGKRDEEINQSYEIDSLKSLIKHLPEGCKLKEITVVRKKPHFFECYADYIFTILQDKFDENIEKRINSVLASESLVIERSINKDKASKKKDVRSFLFSITKQQNSIIVRCKIGSEGSIRVPEIMELLELDTEKLISPIRRTNVQWLG